MKKCKFCGKTANANDTVCASCGASQIIVICANCGNEFESGLYCPRCGVKKGQREKVCPKCGNHYFTNACANCGYKDQSPENAQQPVYNEPVTEHYTFYDTFYVQKKRKRNLVPLLLCIFLGVFGAHKFYEGKFGMGILYLFTAGLFHIGWIYDIIVLAKGDL